ncbi:alpha/beta-hydrolase [Hesseltinella vesiculosa]|uniref:Alpha/beta-hydrolase n=1 Tax=Hesseltinella vesiculosa TaxID=101127 RepID=A0A1X2GX61_9FUNG|nr:alpha/beta-hydrolase [Hesseltinella vesiculosa]
MVDSVEKYYNVHFLPGDNNQLQCIRLNLDPVLSVHRPLAVYLAIFFCTKIFNGLCMSFFWPKPPTLHYWYRPAKPDTTATPLVFIHGIGAGLMCYAEWVFHLTRMDRPIYCVELPFVSMHMVDHVPDADDFVDAIQHMLHTHGHHHAVFVGHSLGTAVTSWVMTRLPQLVAGTVLIDPICFLLHYPNVCFNFIYRAPRQWIDYLMLYVASRELYISHYIARHFQWFQCIYFANRLNGDLTLNQTSPLKRATVYLSTEDSLVPSAMVAKYLIHQRVDCRTMPGLTHAGFLFNWTWRKRILRQIEHIATDVDLEGTDLCMAS